MKWIRFLGRTSVLEITQWETNIFPKSRFVSETNTLLRCDFRVKMLPGKPRYSKVDKFSCFGLQIPNLHIKRNILTRDLAF